MREEIRENMESFISEAEGLIDSLNSSISGVDSEDSEQTSEFLRALHTLKGMAGMMEFTEMEKLCHAMEDMAHQKDIEGLYWAMGILEKMLSAAERGGDTSGFSDEIKSRIGSVKKEKEEWETYKIGIQIRKNEPLKSVRASIIKRDASSFGKIISFKPAPEEIDDDFDGKILMYIKSPLKKEKIISSLLWIRGVEGAWEEEEENYEENRHYSGKNSYLSNTKTMRIESSKIEEIQSLGEEAVIRAHKTRQTLSPADMERLSSVIETLADRILRLRAVPVKSLIPRLHRIVMETAMKENKAVVLNVEGDNVEIDREIISLLGEALVHILKNAVSHGIEEKEERIKLGKNPTGKIEIKFDREGSAIFIRVSDDGRGIDLEKLREKAVKMGKKDIEKLGIEMIFLSGMSTSEKTSSISGRGIGLETVKNIVEDQGGDIDVSSEAGTGTTFRIKLPFSTGILSALLVEINGRYFAIPADSVEKISLIEEGALTSLMSKKFLRDENRVHRILEIYEGEKAQAVIVRFRGSTLAIPVDRVLGMDRIVLKRLEWSGTSIPFKYITLLSDGEMAFVLETASIGRMMEVGTA